MNRILLLLLVLGCAAVAIPRPLSPPVPRVKRVHGPTKGDGAAALLVKPKILPSFVRLRLDWDYPGSLDAIAFKIYQRQPGSPWTVLAQPQLKGTSYQFPVSEGPNVVMFTVVAVNLASGLESATLNQ